LKVEKEQLGTSQWALTVEVDQTQAEAELETELKKLQAESNLPGFRKGKAPLSLIRQRFAKALEADLMHKRLGDYYDQALKEAGLPDPVAPPDIEIQQFETGKPLIFKVVVEVQPPVELAGYENLTVVRERVEVGEEEVDKQIQHLREDQAVISDDENPANPDSLVEADLQELDAGMLPVIGHKREGVLIDLTRGSEDLRTALVGARAGESRNVLVPRKQASPQEEKKFDRLQVSVKSVKRKELPEINDEFAKSLSPDLEGVAGLREALKKSVQAEVDGLSYQRMAHLLVHQMVDHTRLDVPESMLNNYLDKIVADIQRRAQTSQSGPVDEPLVRDRYRSNAIWDLRWYMIRKAISEKEGLKVTEEDFQQELERMAAVSGKKIKMVQAMYSEEKKRNQLEEDLLERKVLQFLVSKARVIERDVSYDEFFTRPEGEHQH
jgi:trigger factor